MAEPVFLPRKVSRISFSNCSNFREFSVVGVLVHSGSLVASKIDTPWDILYIYTYCITLYNPQTERERLHIVCQYIGRHMIVSLYVVLLLSGRQLIPQ